MAQSLPALLIETLWICFQSSNLQWTIPAASVLLLFWPKLYKGKDRTFGIFCEHSLFMPGMEHQNRFLKNQIKRHEKKEETKFSNESVSSRSSVTVNTGRPVLYGGVRHCDPECLS